MLELIDGVIFPENKIISYSILLSIMLSTLVRLYPGEGLVGFDPLLAMFCRVTISKLYLIHQCAIY